jgi:hypothetical protein
MLCKLNRHGRIKDLQNSISLIIRGRDQIRMQGNPNHSKSPWASSKESDRVQSPMWQQEPDSLFAFSQGSSHAALSWRSGIPPPRAAIALSAPDWLGAALAVEARPMSAGRDLRGLHLNASAPVFVTVNAVTAITTPPSPSPLLKTGSTSSLEGYFNRGAPSRVASFTGLTRTTQNAATGYARPYRSPSSSPSYAPPTRRSPIKKVESFIGITSVS